MESQSQGLQLQRLLGCIVQIRNPGNEAIGTGVIVATEGKIATCAHVVRDSLKVNLYDAGGRQLIVYFPPDTRKGLPEEQRHAIVLEYFSEQYEDDVALLQLIDGTLPLSLSRVAILGKAEDSVDNPFRSYGFRPLPPFNGGLADGEIQGEVFPPRGQNGFPLKLLANPIQIHSDQIDAGMSGAPVLDKKRNLVIGIVSATYRSNTTKDQGTAWAVNASIFAGKPFHLPVRDAPPPPLRVGTLLSHNTIQAIQATAKLEPGQKLYGAPLPLSEWVGRLSMLKSLSDDWENQQCSLTGIIGIGGEGKSSLVRQWLDRLLSALPLTQPEGVLWWNFNEMPSVDSFLDAALEYLWNGQLPEGMSKEEIDAAPERFIGGMLGAKRYLFVLDGLEKMQYDKESPYGLLKDERLTNFLNYFVTLSHHSHCMITSRVPLIDLIEYSAYTQRGLGPLSLDEGCDLLRRLGVSGNNTQLEEVAEGQGGYALTISRLGTLLAKQYGGNIADINKIATPLDSNSPEERVSQVLKYYDELLTDTERAFLTLSSAFRAPIPEDAFAKVFGVKTNTLNTCITLLSDTNFNQLIQHLLDYMVLHKNEQGAYTSHPLFRAHYAERLASLPSVEIQKIYVDIADYYQGQARYHREQAEHCFASVQEIDFTPESGSGGWVYQAQRLGALWTQRNWGGGLLPNLIGRGAGAALALGAAILSNSRFRASFGNATQQFPEGWKHKREAKYAEQEALHYRAMIEAIAQK